MKDKFTLYLTILVLPAALVLSVVEAQQRGRGQGDLPTFPEGESQRLVEKLGARAVGVHDPSTIVKENGDYWFFRTGRGVPSFRSKDLKTWEQGPAVVQASPTWLADVVPPGAGRRGRGARGPATAPATNPTAEAAVPPARGRGAGGGVPSFWAPDVIRVGDRYLLYFSYSAFGVNTSCIAMTSSPTLNPDDPRYKWSDPQIVVQSRREDNFNAIDPAMILDQEGRLWMSFGSFWSGIKLIELDPKTGLRIPDSPMHSLAHYDSIEAPFIYHHDGHYYLFLNWGLCCRGVNSTYNMRVGRSRTITGPYLDKDGKDMLTGGGSLLLETDRAFIGPGHPGIIKEGDTYWMSMHFYDGTASVAGGTGGTLAIRPLRWAADGWPVVE